ncbi:MAG: CpaD family pilus assembly lipoprotein [Pseudomonadota bacterium]
MFRSVSLIAVLLGSLGGLTACGASFEMPTVMSERRAELATSTHNQSYAESQITDGFLQQMAQYYARYGAGVVGATVTYDPSVSDSPRDANRLAARISNTLKANGVAEVMTETLPIPNSGREMHALLKFGTITAKGPRDCGQMPAYTGTGGATTNNETYKYGCTVETLMAQQVMRPADLAGRAPTAASDGARQTAVINDRGYYDNKAFAPLAGQTASE